MKKQIAIIGAGASGLISAIISAKRGFIIDIYEKNQKSGRKILATGNGKCNISNQNISIENYHGKNPSFSQTALKLFDRKKEKIFFSELGLELIKGKGTKLYPMSNQASSVVDFLVFEAQRVGVRFHLSHEIKNIEQKNGKFIINKESYQSVLIATGSYAMPNLGSSESGYMLSKSFRHTIIEPFASLTQLISNERIFYEASGVKVESNLELFINGKIEQSIYGDLLFTNYGLSGSAILDLSRNASSALQQNKKVSIKIDLLPHLSIKELIALLQKRLPLLKDQSPNLWLNGIINKKLTNIILKKSKIIKQNINQKSIKDIAFIIKNLEVTIHDTRGAKGAEVMAGGINTNDINPQTMESKLVKGLFFSGEVIDIDGDCGGYNLHWAWASGFLAAQNI